MARTFTIVCDNCDFEATFADATVMQARKAAKLHAKSKSHNTYFFIVRQEIFDHTE